VGEVVGDLRPLAVGVAISPIPIIAVIFMLLSPHAGRTSLGFLVGWVLGILVVTTVVVLLSDSLHEGGEPPAWVSWLKIVLGALCVLLALWQWRKRPAAGTEATMPKWMSAIDSFTFGKAAGLGFVLSAVNPKNLLMCLGAGLTIGAAKLSTGGDVSSVVLFTAISASTVAVPVIVYLAAKERMAKPLHALRDVLARDNAVIMAVVLAVIGFVLVGKGISGLAA
jgi:threonine/homoserine/homoserine lactone efflux protein